MRVDKYKIFIAAAKLGSMSRVAQETGYTQSGISHVIKNIEDEIGFPLFTRTAKGVQLNKEGQVLLPVINSLIQNHETLAQTVTEINGLKTGTIRLAAFSSVAIHWLPQILLEFETLYPHINIQIEEAGVYDIEQMLENAQVDLAIYSHSSNFSSGWIPLLEDPLCAVIPLQHPLAGAQHFPLSAFSQYTFIIPSRNFDYDIHRILDKLLTQPNVKYTLNSDHAIISMVAAGLGISILPRLILNGYEDKVHILPIKPAQQRQLGIAVQNQKNLSPAVKRFIRFLRDYTKLNLKTSWAGF